MQKLEVYWRFSMSQRSGSWEYVKRNVLGLQGCGDGAGHPSEVFTLCSESTTDLRDANTELWAFALEVGTFWPTASLFSPLITHLLIKWEPAWLGLSSSVKWYIYCILQLQAEILRSHRLAKVTQAYFFIYLWINHAYHERFTPNCLFGARKNPFMIYTFFPCKCNWKSIDFCDIYNFPNDCISLGIWFLGVIYLLQKEQKTSKLYFRFS